MATAYAYKYVFLNQIPVFALLNSNTKSRIYTHFQHGNNA
jgi:hypothetical protein